MVPNRSKRKFKRVFFATDLHGSEIVFRKFIGAAKFYDVDSLIMGGDVFGKTMVPLVADGGGKYTFTFQGKTFDHVPESDLPKFEEQFMNGGEYPQRLSSNEYAELRADPAKVSTLFETLMSDRLSRWARMATEYLLPLDVKCYWTGGNDDKQEVLDRVTSTNYFVNVDGKVVRLDDEHELASLGWSNPTPWQTPRECGEVELGLKLDQLTRYIADPSTCIFNIHPPPYDSNLDIAPKLDTSFDPPRPVTSGGQEVLIPVGSTSVRATIEKFQPLLMLCGHIHETKNDSKIKRTTCINPGSEYTSGLLRGVIVNMEKNKVLSHQFTSG